LLVEDLAYSPDGLLIAVCDALGAVLAVDAETLAPVGVPVALRCRTADVGVAAGGHRALVMVGGPEGAVGDSSEFVSPFSGWALADLVTGEILGRWNAPFDLWAAALSMDGRMVALGGVHGEIAVADAETGQLVATPASAGDARVTRVAWSPGNRLVATGIEGGVSLWDGTTCELLGSVMIPERTIARPVFHHDERTVGIMSWRDGYYTWDTSLDHAVEFASTMIGRLPLSASDQ
jgi:WD40 repeat protein